MYLRGMAIHTATGEASRVYSISREIIHEVSLNDYFSRLRITEVTQVSQNINLNHQRHKINTQYQRFARKMQRVVLITEN